MKTYPSSGSIMYVMPLSPRGVVRDHVEPSQVGASPPANVPGLWVSKLNSSDEKVMSNWVESHERVAHEPLIVQV